MMLLSLIVLLQIANNCLACPFYQNIATNISNTVNYTIFANGLQAAMLNDLPLIICDGAKVRLNETIPIITKSVTVIGENPVGQRFAYFTIENPDLNPAFVINAANTDIVMFENINFVFETTLFQILGDSRLVLSNSRCWFGDTCVEISAALTGIIAPPGLEADTVTFMANGIGILFYSGHIKCNHCTFYDSLVASVLLRNPTPTPADYIEMYDHHYANCLFPIAQQLLGPGGPLNAPSIVSDSYTDATNFFNCQSYKILPLPTLDGTFGGKSFSESMTNTTCPDCDCASASVIGDIIAGLSFLIFLMLIWVLVSRNKSKPINKKQTNI